MTPRAVDPGEQQPGDDSVDDIAVFSELGQPDGLADLRQADVAWGQLDDLVLDPEFAGHAAGVGYVVAAGSPDGERHAVGVHVTYVQEGQRAIQTTRENNADG